MFEPTLKIYLIIAVSGFFILIMAYSIMTSLKIKTYEDYNVAGRNISTASLILTMMGTAIGGATILGFSGSGYLLGIGRAWEILPAYFFVVFVIVFLLKAIYKIGYNHNLITIPDFTALRYGEKARLPSTLAILMAYCAITGMQFTAISTFIHLVTGMNMTTGILIAWFVLTTKTYLGGLKAVIHADTIQGTIQNIGIVILFSVLFWQVGGFSGAIAKAEALGQPELMSFFNIPLDEFLVFFLTLGAFQIVRQDSWQRIWAAKKVKVAQKSFWIATSASFILTFAIFYIGTFGRLLGVMVEDPALAFYIISDAVLPPVVLVIVITALMATIISSADSNLVAGASSVVNDVFRPFWKTKDEKELLKMSRYAVLLTSTVGMLLALYIPRLIELWVTGAAMLTSGLMVPILASFFWPKATNAGGVAALWGGIIAAIVWQLSGHPFGIHPVFIGMPISFVLLIIVSRFTTPSSPNTVNRLLYKNNR